MPHKLSAQSAQSAKSAQSIQVMAMPASPKQSPSEAYSREAFLALMWALSYPGSGFALPTVSNNNDSDGLQSIGHALLDLETSYYTADAELERALRKTGAISWPLAAADYVFFPRLTAQDIPALEQLKVGDYTYPDNSATLIVGCAFDNNATHLSAQYTALCLNGPGIQEVQTIHVAELPDSFWALRAGLIRYPLGIDIMLVSRGWVIGLPRTTQVSLCM